jgi:DNA-directed RNA polymerase specialized sigma24 family protein
VKIVEQQCQDCTKLASKQENVNQSHNGDELDQRLKELALIAQQHPSQTPQRQVALTRLWQGIMSANRLGHPQKGRWNPEIYEDLYNDAIARTGLEICQKIERYDQNYPLMAWVNNCLRYNFIHVAQEYYKNSALPSLDDLDIDVPVDETPSEAEMLRQFLREDPEGLLQAERLSLRPDVTFQFLALSRYVQDRTWKSIADELDIPLQTLCAFFMRRLQKLKPYFYKHLQDQIECLEEQ